MNRLTVKKSLVLIVLFFLVFLFLAPAYSALAQEGEYDPITVLPGVYGEGQSTQIEGFLQRVFVFLIGAAAVMAVVQITIGGVQYMTSSAAGSLEDAKSRIRMAIIGLLLILSTYIILQQINPNLVQIKLGTTIEVGQQSFPGVS